MNTKLLNHRIAFASILFIFAISLQTKAQDTIYCPDNRYYWNNIPCDYGRSIFENKDAYRSYVSLDNIGSVHSGYTGPIYGTGDVNKVLLQQVFNDTIRRQIYGIAGTTIGCYNPNGCYFICTKK